MGINSDLDVVVCNYVEPPHPPTNALHGPFNPNGPIHGNVNGPVTYTNGPMAGNGPTSPERDLLQKLAAHLRYP